MTQTRNIASAQEIVRRAATHLWCARVLAAWGLNPLEKRMNDRDSVAMCVVSLLHQRGEGEIVDVATGFFENPKPALDRALAMVTREALDAEALQILDSAAGLSEELTDLLLHILSMVDPMKSHLSYDILKEHAPEIFKMAQEELMTPREINARVLVALDNIAGPLLRDQLNLLMRAYRGGLTVSQTRVAGEVDGFRILQCFEPAGVRVSLGDATLDINYETSRLNDSCPRDIRIYLDTLRLASTLFALSPDDFSRRDPFFLRLKKIASRRPDERVDQFFRWLERATIEHELGHVQTFERVAEFRMQVNFSTFEAVEHNLLEILAEVRVLKYIQDHGAEELLLLRASDYLYVCRPFLEEKLVDGLPESLEKKEHRAMIWRNLELLHALLSEDPAGSALQAIAELERVVAGADEEVFVDWADKRSAKLRSLVKASIRDFG